MPERKVDINDYIKFPREFILSDAMSKGKY